MRYLRKKCCEFPIFKTSEFCLTKSAQSFNPGCECLPGCEWLWVSDTDMMLTAQIRTDVCLSCSTAVYQLQMSPFFSSSSSFSLSAAALTKHSKWFLFLPWEKSYPIVSELSVPLMKKSWEFTSLLLLLAEHFHNSNCSRKANSVSTLIASSSSFSSSLDYSFAFMCTHTT